MGGMYGSFWQQIKCCFRLHNMERNRVSPFQQIRWNAVTINAGGDVLHVDTCPYCYKIKIRIIP